ncbi:hypothetical protein [Moraxella lacunata]|uniref:hypothetical protein n=1 Tax=Moraxella lacunata TaxID=477 RepID=UPI003EE00BE2
MPITPISANISQTFKTTLRQTHENQIDYFCPNCHANRLCKPSPSTKSSTKP